MPRLPNPVTLLKAILLAARRLTPLLLSPLAAAVAFLALLSAAMALGYLGIYAVPTGSMEPVIPQGSLIVVERVHPSELKIGDVALVVDRQLGLLVAHRVVAKDMEMGVVAVKGDAVAAVTEVAFQDVVGVVVFHVPLLGYPFIHRQLLVALALLAVVVALYMILR